MSILSILDTNTGQVMISIVLGLGLASLFQRVCAGDEKCMVYLAPDENKITGRVFTQNGKCYKYVRENVACAVKNQ